MSQHKCGSSKPKIKKNSSNILQSKNEWSYTVLYTILNRQYCQRNRKQLCSDGAKLVKQTHLWFGKGKAYKGLGSEPGHQSTPKVSTEALTKPVHSFYQPW